MLKRKIYIYICLNKMSGEVILFYLVHSAFLQYYFCTLGMNWQLEKNPQIYIWNFANCVTSLCWIDNIRICFVTQMDSYILQENIYSLSFFHLPLESFSLQSLVCVFKADFLPVGHDAPPAGGRVWFLFLKTRKEILLQWSEGLTAIQILIYFTHQHCHFKN